MSAVVKFPARCAGDPDKRFCGLCGRRNQPLVSDREGFGACVEGADSVVACDDVRRAVVGAHALARALERPLHPEWQAFVSRLGLPAEMVAAWVGKAERVEAIKDHLRRGCYGMDGGAPFMPALAEWVADGDDADEKLIALIGNLRVHLDPLAATGQPMTMLEIGEWYGRLGLRAAAVIAEVPDFEYEDGGDD